MNLLSKKLFILIPILLLSLLTISCKTTSEDRLTKLENVANTLLNGIDLNNITDDLNLVTEINGVNITWTSDNNSLINNQGVIFPNYKDNQVYIYAELSYENIVIYRTFNITIKRTVNLDQQKINTIIPKLLENVNIDNIIADLNFQTEIDDVLIAWESENPSVITNEGNVTQQNTDVEVVIYAYLMYKSATDRAKFTITVKKLNSIPDDGSLNQQKLDNVKNSLLQDINLNQITDDIFFPSIIDGVHITWESNNIFVIENSGKINPQEVDELVGITAYLSYENLTATRTFSVNVLRLEENDYDYSIYYTGVDGLKGLTLKLFLHNLIDDHKSYSYDFAKTALQKTDEDPNNSNNVILFYTGRSQAKSTFGGGVNQWNREHVWAKSHGGFGDSIPAGSDIHHLRPTDVSVNSARGNLDFDMGGTKVNSVYGLNSTFCYKDSDSFEPRDEVKGDVARIIFYMAVRYDGSDGVKNLELNDRVNNGNNPYMGKLSVLLEWNEFDPVDDFERNRNDVIYSYQGNRNPFIDYPEFANYIWQDESISKTNVIEKLLEFSFINIDLNELKRRDYCLYVA